MRRRGCLASPVRGKLRLPTGRGQRRLPLRVPHHRERDVHRGLHRDERSAEYDDHSAQLGTGRERSRVQSTSDHHHHGLERKVHQRQLVEVESDERRAEHDRFPAGEQVRRPVQQPGEKDQSCPGAPCRGVEPCGECRPDHHRRDRVRVDRHSLPLVGEHERDLEPVGAVAGEHEGNDEEARLASLERHRHRGVTGVHSAGHRQCRRVRGSFLFRLS
jgi:hypothetical protein